MNELIWPLYNSWDTDLESRHEQLGCGDLPCLSCDDGGHQCEMVCYHFSLLYFILRDVFCELDLTHSCSSVSDS